jgi:Trk K+ transport system NAD-binding subunit
VSRMKLTRSDSGERMLSYAGECDAKYQDALSNWKKREVEAKLAAATKEAEEAVAVLVAAASNLKTKVVLPKVLSAAVVKILRAEGLDVLESSVSTTLSFKPSEPLEP